MLLIINLHKFGSYEAYRLFKKKIVSGLQLSFKSILPFLNGHSKSSRAGLVDYRQSIVRQERDCKVEECSLKLQYSSKVSNFLGCGF